MENIPMIDTHCHVLPVETKVEPLAALLCNYALLPTLLSAGMPGALAQRLENNALPPEEAKAALLPFLSKIAQTSAAQAVCQGILHWTEQQGSQITEENYDVVDKALQAKPFSAYGESFRQANVAKALVNVNSAQGAALFTGEMQLLPDFAKHFALIPTFDAFALHPKEAHMQRVAAALGVSLEHFDGYLAFIEAYLDGFSAKFPVAGLKISEQYFRRLNYAQTPRKAAEKQFAQGDWEAKPLQDFITNHVFVLAEQRELTVQLHTGMLWGEISTKNLHPADLSESVKRFPKLRFDLLHVGFPHLGEAAAMALYAPHVSLNLSWLPLVSERLTADWLVRLLEMLPASKISFGTDVFDVPSLLGTAALIRKITEKAVLPFSHPNELARRLLFQNAAELYRI